MPLERCLWTMCCCSTGLCGLVHALGAAMLLEQSWGWGRRCLTVVLVLLVLRVVGGGVGVP